MSECAQAAPTRSESAAAEPVATVVGFARTLRAAGVAATTDRIQELVRALSVLDATSTDAVRQAGRATLCSSPEDLARYDAAFFAYFGGERPTLRARHRPPLVIQLGDLSASASDAGGAADTEPVLRGGASRTEVLRSRDLAALTAADRQELHRVLAALRLAAATRRTRRHGPSRRGELDRHRTVRALLERGGEPARLLHRTRQHRPRRLVLLLDVSGSMAPYAGAMLRFAHAAARRQAGGVEVFTIGTRLTRVTDELRRRDPDAAMAAVAGTVADFNGGTRLGELLKAFLDGWGRRGMARGAVVVVLSDGWECGDVTLLGEQMANLSRLAHRVVWANPRKGREGFTPTAAGMAAALPYVDDFVEGHSLAALEHLAQVVSGRA